MNKFSEIIRKRAMLGVAVFCIAAIATVGVLSQGNNNGDNTPDSFVDLNEREEKEDKQQIAQTDTPDIKTSEQQITENDTNVQEKEQLTAKEQEVTDSKTTEQQVVDNTTTVEKIDTSTQTAQQEEIDINEIEQVEETQVLSPQLIAEQLTFDKSAGLLYPIQGEVVIPYSPDHAVFHFTLEQFSTSDAVVLSSSVGTQVKAAAKGVVTAIEEDDRIGTTVTMAVGNNTSLVYGQLEVDGLQEGDMIEAGECIGTVAEPTKYYVVEGPNLYFQVLEGEESLDPILLFTDSE